LRDESLRAPWVIVAGGIDEYGAMDKANLAVARHLVASHRLVHLVAHRVADEFQRAANVRIHLAPTPAGSLLLGEMHLSRRGREVATRLGTEGTAPIVLSNGGNCAWPGVNWVHSLHHAWPTVHQGAPAMFRLKNTITKASAKYREARAIRLARLVIANSHRTEEDIVKWMPETSGRVQTVYLGSDPSLGQQSSDARLNARQRLAIADDVPVVLFAGALSYDNNKGLDVLLDAWRLLFHDGRWDSKLLVAGGGGAVQAWRDLVAAHPALAGSVTVLGHVSKMNELYAASDLLVAPSRYEAYGLAAHEAICAGLPVLISRTAGISERYSSALNEMILHDPTDAAELAGKLRSWRPDAVSWPKRFALLRRELTSRSWGDMAEQIVQLAESRLTPAVHPYAEVAL
jgi:glycosyltransferase involved in cell wall biosynthesis